MSAHADLGVTHRDSYAANRSAIAHLPLTPRTVASAVCPAHRERRDVQCPSSLKEGDKVVRRISGAAEGANAVEATYMQGRARRLL